MCMYGCVHACVCLCVCVLSILMDNPVAFHWWLELHEAFATRESLLVN